MILYICINKVCERYRYENLTAPVSRWLLSPTIERGGLFFVLCNKKYGKKLRVLRVGMR